MPAPQRSPRSSPSSARPPRDQRWCLPPCPLSAAWGSVVTLGPCPLVPPVPTRTPELAARSPPPPRTPRSRPGGRGAGSPLPCTSLRRRRRRRRLASAAERRQQQEQRQTFPSHGCRAAHTSRRGTASRVSRSRRESRGDPGAPGRQRESRTHPCPPAHTPLPAPPPARGTASGTGGQRAGPEDSEGSERGPGAAPEPRASGAARRRRAGGAARLQDPRSKIQDPGSGPARGEEGGTCLPDGRSPEPGSVLAWQCARRLN